MQIVKLSNEENVKEKLNLEGYPEWFFHQYSPLSLESWVIQQENGMVTLLLGNSGFKIELKRGENVLVQHYMPGVENTEDKEVTFNYSSLYVLVLESFLKWWNSLPLDNEFRQIHTITGSTNETMFTFRKKVLDLLGDNLIEGYLDTYDNEWIYHMDLNRLTEAFKNESTIINRLLKNGNKLIGNLSMLNPLAYLIKSKSFI